jgi:adenosylcobinamide-GDP ribazoletransferase
MAEEDRVRAEAEAVIDDLASGTVFLTRLPAEWLGRRSDMRPDFRRGARLFPVIGALVGIAGGAVLVITAALGVPPFVAATLAVIATMLFTGALHEDGLADTLDGFGGGATAARKLEIMDDSRIGAYGAAALVFSILLRVGALSSLAVAAPFHAALALVAAEAISRAALVRLWQELPAARLGGLAHETGPPDQTAMLIALAAGFAIALLTVWPSIGFWAAIVGILLSIAATYIFTRISTYEIGGRTGDTLGACQQIAAVAFLAGVAGAA